ncbi:MAG: AraC family transcriptional regulator [Luteimonas sp.]
MMLQSGYIIRALRRIEDSPRASPGLAALSVAAGFSPFHFHRHFLQVMGETVGSYVRRTRLDAAAAWLGDSDESIMSIALTVGYQNHESLTRAFKRRFGLPPLQYRALARSQRGAIMLRDLELAGQVQHRRIASQSLIGMRFFGPYARIGEFWARFVQTLLAHGIDPGDATPVGVRRDHPGITPAQLTRYDCCIVDSRSPASVRPPFARYTLHNGSVATLLHDGSYDHAPPRHRVINHAWCRLHDRRIETVLSYEFYHRPPWLARHGPVSMSIMIPIH